MSMNTATRNTLAKNPIAQTLINVYGVTAMAADPLHIEWAAERVLASDGREVTGKALRQVNRARERMGKMPMYPTFHSPLFNL